jgi:hypothetical protein
MDDPILFTWQTLREFADFVRRQDSLVYVDEDDEGITIDGTLDRETLADFIEWKEGHDA